MTSTRRRRAPSQLVDLFLSVAGSLGFTRDRDVAALASVVAENVGNWRSGSVREFKTQTLNAIKSHLGQHIETLRDEVSTARQMGNGGLHPLIIEEGAGPDELLNQFRDRVSFDYLGHRFLYYEPQGAVAWLSLISAGYEQQAWLRGTQEAARSWLDLRKDVHGRFASPIVQRLRGGSGASSRGLDIIGLGSGDGAKENAVLQSALPLTNGDAGLDWLSFAPVDVSIPLLLRAAATGRATLSEADDRGVPWRHSVTPFCADFEEGPLRFVDQVPTSRRGADEGVRLILLLGNVFGNLRDEDAFVRDRLWRLARPGDFVWLEVALRMDTISSHPLFKMTLPDHTETAVETHRRLLLEGPFRRWEAATRRRPADLSVRVSVRQDDLAAQIPGSLNFCHDLVLAEQRRVCTMLYSRRYQPEPLVRWFEDRQFSVERLSTVTDSKQRARVMHMLLRRLPA